MDAFAAAFNAYRIYNDDGGEAASTPKAAQDTAATISNNSNANFHLRGRVDEVGSGSISGATTDDYGLEYRVNGGGGWIAVSDVTSRVQATGTGSQLSDGSATTNRATNGISDPGSGSFVAGGQDEGDGVVDNRQLTADNFTEHVWALTLVAADNSNGDFLEFRMTLNGSSTNITSNVTPRVDITKTASTTSTADAGSYSVTGAAATSTAQRPSTGEAGSHAVTGASATSTVQVASTGSVGSYAVSGAAATSTQALNSSADAGSYALTGADAQGDKSKNSTAEAGSYAVTGADATSTAQVASTAEAGSYALSGQAATSTKDTPSTAEAGSHAVSGQEATSTVQVAATAGAGIYALSGQDATGTVQAGSNITSTADAGSYAVSGQEATSTTQVAGSANAGSYAVSGQEATGTVGAGGPVNTDSTAEAGSYAVSGVDAEANAVAATIKVGGGGGSRGRRYSKDSPYGRHLEKVIEEKRKSLDTVNAAVITSSVQTLL